ncbi:MAG TPA: (d)CMP kinase, partial [Candidatus Baltobacteraceae bacterium]|nr:(d)CMP kinase [Candidatus Baltobacteraceae bacterium]
PPMAEVRLQKVLADAGVASRRGAEALITTGRVNVDGLTAHLGQRVDPRAARILVDGRPLRAPASHVYLALNKPIGVTSTVRDRHATRTVVDLVPSPILSRAGRLYPVGRLDRDSEGLVLLTNDGDWSQRVAHPSHELAREYAVQVGAPLEGSQVAALRNGIGLDDGLAQVGDIRPATTTETARLAASVVPPPTTAWWYRVTIAQGWRRQLRRMFAAVGVPVQRLVRVRIGTLWLGGLPSGEVRELEPVEVRRLGGPGAHGAPGAAAHGTSTGDGLVVSLDGPASSGKSTVGAAVAARLGYRFCDTGLLYRALTWLALERRTPLEDERALAALVPEVVLAADDRGALTRVTAHGRDVTAAVHDTPVDRHVSGVARHPAVRAALVPVQRALAAPGRILMAGRDIGTAILPDADLKLYLDVTVEERARRRVAQRALDPRSPAAEAVLADLRERDAIDSHRAVGPLRVPPDAVVVRSDGRTLDQTVRAVVSRVRAAERAAAARTAGPGMDHRPRDVRAR